MLKKLNSLKTSNPILNWAKHLSRHFAKEDTQMAHKYMEKMFNIISHWKNAN